MPAADADLPTRLRQWCATLPPLPPPPLPARTVWRAWCAEEGAVPAMMAGLPRLLPPPPRPRPGGWWRPILAQGFAAARLAPREASLAATATLLLAAAPLVVAQVSPRRLLAAQLEAHRRAEPVAHALARPPHPVAPAAIAAQLADRWGLSAAAAVLAAHGSPRQAWTPVLAAAAVAPALLALRGVRMPGDGGDTPMPQAPLRALGIDAAMLVEAIGALSAAVDAARAVLAAVRPRAAARTLTGWRPAPVDPD